MTSNAKSLCLVLYDCKIPIKYIYIQIHRQGEILISFLSMKWLCNGRNATECFKQ